MTDKTKLSSTPILHTAMRWGGIIGVIVVVAAGAIGVLIAGVHGLFSGVIGASVGVVFPMLTALSIVIANRWYGTPGYLTTFFAVVLGSWLLKFVVVIVLLVLLQGVEWVHPLVFFFSLVAGAVASLAVDLIVLQRMRLPAVSDAALPTEDPEP